MSKLAIIDWGIGGMGFYRQWKNLRPDEGVVYFSDSGCMHYGKLDDETLSARLNEVITYLNSEYSVTHVMVACNAASTVLDRCIAGKVSIQGVIKPTVKWMGETFKTKLAVTGGIKTIESNCYSSKEVGLEVSGIVAQPLSALVESGQLTGKLVEETITDLFGNISGDLVLACTHYIALADEIERIFPQIRCHDPMDDIVAKRNANWPGFGHGPDTFLTTGDVERMKTSSELAFGVSVSPVMVHIN